MSNPEDDQPSAPKVDSILLGLVRKAYPQLLANQILGVQPMYSSPEYIRLIPWNKFSEEEQTKVLWKGTIHSFGVCDPIEAIAVDRILMDVFGKFASNSQLDDSEWQAFNIADENASLKFKRDEVRRAYCFPTNQLMLEMFLRINQQPVKP